VSRSGQTAQTNRASSSWRRAGLPERRGLGMRRP
jgi:hypothetical protein